MIRFLILLAMMIAGLIIPGPMLASDFTHENLDKLAEAVKKINKQIAHVHIIDNGGQELLVIQYRAEVSPDPLLQESKNLRDIARRVSKTTGAGRFTGLLYFLMIPARDEFNNPLDVEGLKLYWAMSTLQKINWKGFQSWQFLDMVDSLSQGPMGPEILKAYCGNGNSYSERLCLKVKKCTQEHYQCFP